MEKINTVKDLIAFFSIPERPVSPAEFMDFWKSLTVAEKDYYHSVKI